GAVEQTRVLDFLVGDVAGRGRFKILDGFSGWGKSLEDELEARSKEAALRTDNRAAATKELVGVLRLVRDDSPKGLQRLGLAEVVQSLRRDRDGLGLTQNALAEAAERFGVVAEEAEELAFAV